MERRGTLVAPARSVFFLFRDSPLRRASLDAEPGSAERYWLYGADQLPERGFAVRHSLEPAFVPRGWHRRADRALRAALAAGGGYGGDFATVLASRGTANRSDVVFSTVDTVGIPAMLLAQARLVRPPIVYASIGLLGRIAQLRTAAARGLYERALGRAAVVVAYGYAEAEALRVWLARRPSPPHVRFVPFGVDITYFRPDASMTPDVDVLSLGADPERDYELLAHVAARLPDSSFSVVASPEQARALRDMPANVRVETEIPFPEIRDRLARTRVVALPVRDNLYSGATTTLLQAMASAKPAVVSRTAAIADGYGLRNGENCLLVPPGDARALEHAIRDLLADSEGAAALGVRARAMVERRLTWDRYVDSVADVLASAAESAVTR